MKTWWRDMTKDQVETLIRDGLANQPFNQPFPFELLADLLIEHHSGIKTKGIKPTLFRKTHPNPYGGDYLLEGLYDDRWIKNSYRQTLYPETLRTQVFKMFRRAIVEPIVVHLRNYPACHQCGGTAEEVDHISPSFKQIAESLYRCFSEDHWKYWIEQHRWEDNQPRTLPDHHPSVIYLKYIHTVNSGHKPSRWVRLQSLCKSCHQQITRSRRSAEKIEEPAS